MKISDIFSRFDANRPKADPVDALFEQMEALARKNKRVFDALQGQSLETISRIVLNVPENYPNARAALPRMPPAEVQISYTGNHGETLLAQSSAFMRSLQRGYETHTGQSLIGKNILDYGCGWGRLIRLAYAFTTPDKLFACDPIQESLDICREHNVQATFALCDAIPQRIPFAGVKMDLIFAFSVFTHLSERTAKAVMAACREAIADNGLMVITIRPPTYWDLDIQPNIGVDREKMKADHASAGFAFVPHNRPPIDGEYTYGDTSISVEYLSQSWPGWQCVGTELNESDPYQIMAFMKPTAH